MLSHAQAATLLEFLTSEGVEELREKLGPTQGSHIRDVVSLLKSCPDSVTTERFREPTEDLHGSNELEFDVYHNSLWLSCPSGGDEGCWVSCWVWVPEHLLEEDPTE